jgi:hypothetical protein
MGPLTGTLTSNVPNVGNRSRSESFPFSLAAVPRVQILGLFQLVAPNQAASAEGRMQPRWRRGSGMRSKGRARVSGSPFLIPFDESEPDYLLPRRFSRSVASSLRSLSRPSLKTPLIMACAFSGPYCASASMVFVIHVRVFTIPQ